MVLNLEQSARRAGFSWTTSRCCCLQDKLREKILALALIQTDWSGCTKGLLRTLSVCKAPVCCLFTAQYETGIIAHLEQTVILDRVAKQRQDQSSGKRLLPVPATSESDKRARLPTGSIPADRCVPSSLLSPDQIQRISANREAAIQRRTASSPGPSQTLSALGLSTATSSSVTDASTPPTTQRTSVTRSLPSLDRPLASPQQQHTELAAQKLFRAIGTRLPTVPLPDDRCFKCASAIHTGACTNKTVNQLLYDANCCSSCALPL